MENGLQRQVMLCSDLEDVKMALEASAKKCGFLYRRVELPGVVKEKSWQNPETGATERVEKAMLGWYRTQGWQGTGEEGGPILNLIKTCCFTELPPTNRLTYVEAIFANNVAFEGDRLDIIQLLTNIMTADEARIKKNFRFMLDRGPHTVVHRSSFGSFTSINDGTILSFFPDLTEKALLGLFRALGRERLHAIASIFVQDSYRFRAGWPDLTLWQEGEILFVEVKAIGDRLQNSQKDIIESILVPLGLTTELVEVYPLPFTTAGESITR
jgi:hypothetical protein